MKNKLLIDLDLGVFKLTRLSLRRGALRGWCRWRTLCGKTPGFA